MANPHAPTVKPDATAICRNLGMFIEPPTKLAEG
jgi:hypothetical protein